ncbi:hypothetical protein MUB23_07015 [Cuneatibacter sp. NSJ-177]|jgi:hypothetical protein|uniref:hypothetical protein n=1 Tax=Cuneatibacter sp. NSJ-177 TaxID=2931401 RepID=UPI001FD58D27|nr:hypothetical protein [Cuneatibacter sp. NSJ-177]MCJ7835144.1 hypothetical protein [Cuneatibacter sp. NSJ-177]
MADVGCNMGVRRSWQAKLARMTSRKGNLDKRAFLVKKRLDEVKDALNNQRK